MSHSKSAFTLVEIMVAMTIGVALLAMITPFVTECLKTSLSVTNKLDIELSIRKITNELTDEARESNSFIIYKSFFDQGHDIAGSFRSTGSGQTSADYRQRNGQFGNFCILIFYGDDPTPSDAIPPPIERIVGYYLNTYTLDEEAELKKFDINIPANSQYQPIEELIPAQNLSLNHEVVIKQAAGLISGYMFYNLSELSIMVNCMVIHDNPSKKSSGTYNFTISPRG
ncbi:MAG: prepilin-type N-terminal cleavage/methylation domain-containing protein [Opitutae bacterium]|nr:prepilin-type N-terminal cleavage/methylation domain-containing protein [Opitutae bacterium]